MSDKILVAYATAAGSTGEVAEAIGKALREGDATVDVRHAKEVTDVDDYSAVVLGTGVRAGHVRLMMKAMKKPEGDFRDWTAIRAWAVSLRPSLSGA